MLYRPLTSLFLAVAASTISLGTAQNSLDIGPVNAAGFSVKVGSGSWNVTGSGQDIWGYTDSFHYLHMEKSNDVTVTVFCENFEQNYRWAKAGVQIRDSLDKKAPHASMFITGAQYASAGWRKVFGEASDGSNILINTHRVWLRLTKEGNKITSYYKLEDGLVFEKLREEFFDFTRTSFYVGIAVTSHINGELATFTGSNFKVQDDTLFLPVRDVGDTGRPIVKEEANGVMTIKAAGSGIGGNSDSFGYVNKKFEGDINVTTHLHKMEGDNIDSKGGLMIRASGSADTPHVSLLVHQRSGGLTMFYRESTGGDTLSKTVGVFDNDMDLMVQTSGNTVTCFYKRNGFPDWYELGSATINMGPEFQVGVALTSAYYARHSTLTTGDIFVNGVRVDWAVDA